MSECIDLVKAAKMSYMVRDKSVTARLEPATPAWKSNTMPLSHDYKILANVQKWPLLSV